MKNEKMESIDAFKGLMIASAICIPFWAIVAEVIHIIFG